MIDIYTTETKFKVLYSDNPLWYANRKTGGERNNKTKFGGGAQKHYPLMKDEELLAMSPVIKNISTENSAMFMWATMPKLDFCIELLKAWGFRYTTTAFVWVKPVQDWKEEVSKGKQLRWKNGPGFYTGSNSEIVILGVKGSMQPNKKMLDSVIIEPVREHSRKPDEVKKRIELMYDGPRLEMFARTETVGWESWGNQTSKF
jgi:N6-adenosine-specific RNA methylase IME4